MNEINTWFKFEIIFIFSIIREDNVSTLLNCPNPYSLAYHRNCYNNYTHKNELLKIIEKAKHNKENNNDCNQPGRKRAVDGSLRTSSRRKESTGK